MFGLDLGAKMIENGGLDFPDGGFERCSESWILIYDVAQDGMTVISVGWNGFFQQEAAGNDEFWACGKMFDGGNLSQHKPE